MARPLGASAGSVSNTAGNRSLLLRHFAAAWSEARSSFGIISVSLLIGMVGYHVFGRLDSWIDCLYNAAMILGGMGPAAELHTNAGKVFASLYALYSGVTLLTSVGVLMAPAVHRMLHRFHIETEEDETR